ncbi:TPA: DapH/DapD/GlmU-related protein [Providencia stuartii]
MKLIIFILLKICRINYESLPVIKGIPLIKNKGVIKLGKCVTLISGIIYNPVGGNKTIISVNKNAKLTIGHKTGISNSIIYCRKEISIGCDVYIGANVHIYDTDFHSIDIKSRLTEGDQGISKKITIEDGVFIGAHSIILKGSHIGKNCVIGAGSVVTGKLDNDSVYAGNPIKLIKKL